MKKLILSFIAVMVMSQLLLIAIGSNMTIEIYSTIATFLGAFIVGFTIVALYKITKYIKANEYIKNWLFKK
jgi:peptidoglycan/LPS O-acetylase OafA/YrhL